MEPYSLNINGTLHRYDTPLVMGIVNVTPDSFWVGSRTPVAEEVEKRVRLMVGQGADMLDIGGYSTRPGAAEVSEQEEIDRLAAGMEALRRVAPSIPVSVDTFRARVAHVAVKELGCNIVNDVSGTNLDPYMAATVAALKVPYILSHMRGTPRDMQEYTQYEDVTADVLSELGERLQWLTMEGVADIIIDPGIGFSKTLEQNYRLIHDLEVFRLMHRPILVGVSRKSLLTRMLDIDASQALEATVALETLCLDRGAAIIRAHDVLAARQAVRVYNAVNNPPSATDPS